MTLDKLLRLTRFFVTTLFTSLLVSCTASKHAGITTVNEPPITENNESAWFLYYEDQFDAKEGNVAAPSTQYPESAIRAHQRAMTNWKRKVQIAKERTIIAYIGGGVIIGVIIKNILDPPIGNIGIRLSGTL